MCSKVYIFDLDNTLYLREVDPDYKIIYEYELIIFLNNLKKNNKILAIASHNTIPRYYLEKINICNYFDYIIGEYPRSKYCMIEEILKNIKIDKCITKNDVIFFDDLNSNIKNCQENGIKSIKVDPKKGIEFQKYI